jgi:hypothetical protein
MSPQFDIFRLYNGGTNVWLEAANTLDAARTRIQQLGGNRTGDYFIFDNKTAQKVAPRAEEANPSQLSRNLPDI